MTTPAELNRLRSHSDGDDIPIDYSHPLHPEALIRNNALRHFWRSFVSPSDSIRKISLVSKLTNALAAPIGPRSSNESYSDNLPTLPCGYGLTESEVILLLRAAPRGFLDEIFGAIDLDATGVITAAKVDIATRSIPIDASLRDTLLFLAHQGGSKVVLPAVEFESTKASVLSAISSVQPITFSSESKKSGGQPLVDMVLSLGLYSIAADEMIRDETQNQILEMMTSTRGWGIIVGESGVGKTFRALSAGRLFLGEGLHALSQENAVGREKQYIHRKIAAFTNRGERARESNYRKSPSNLLYLDLSGCRVKCDILASIASQLGVSEGGGVGGQEETEQRVNRFLDQLSEGSVFIIDNAYVHSDYFKNQRSSISTECNVCVILSSIFGRFLSKLVLVMILRNSGEMLSPEKENQIYQDLFVEENEELKELNLLSSGDDSVVNTLSINSLSLKDFPLNRKLNVDGENNENDTLDGKTVFKIVKILPLNKSNSELMTEKFIQNNSCSDSELSLTQNHGNRVELISTLSSGYIKLINTLSKVSLTCLKNISVAIPAGTQVDTRDVISLLYQHPREGLGEKEYLLIRCLRPILDQNLTFDEKMAWAVCKRFFDDKITWDKTFFNLMKIGWLSAMPSISVKKCLIYSISGFAIESNTYSQASGDFSSSTDYLRYVAIKTAALNEELVYSNLPDASSSNLKFENLRSRSEIVREIDFLLPHIKNLSNIWIPKKKEKKPKISFADFISKEINDIDENDADLNGEIEQTSVSINIDDIVDGKENENTRNNSYGVDEDRNENNNENKNNNENIENNQNKSSDKNYQNDENNKNNNSNEHKNSKSNRESEVPLSDFQEFLRSQSEWLCVLIAGRIAAISTLRFSTPDSLLLCYSVVKILKSLRPTNSVEYRDSKSALSMSRWRDLYLAALLDLSRAFTVASNKFLTEKANVLTECVNILEEEKTRTHLKNVQLCRIKIELAAVQVFSDKKEISKISLEKILSTLQEKELEKGKNSFDGNQARSVSPYNEPNQSEMGSGIKRAPKKSLNIYEEKNENCYEVDENENENENDGSESVINKIEKFSEKFLLADTLQHLALHYVSPEGRVAEKIPSVTPGIKIPEQPVIPVRPVQESDPTLPPAPPAPHTSTVPPRRSTPPPGTTHTNAHTYTSTSTHASTHTESTASDSDTITPGSSPLNQRGLGPVPTPILSPTSLATGIVRDNSAQPVNVLDLRTNLSQNTPEKIGSRSDLAPSPPPHTVSQRKSSGGIHQSHVPFSTASNTSSLDSIEGQENAIENENLTKVITMLQNAQEIYAEEGSLLAADIDILMANILIINDNPESSMSFFESALQRIRLLGDSALHRRNGQVLAGLASLLSLNPDQISLSSRYSSESLTAYLTLFPEDHPVVEGASVALSDLLCASDMDDDAISVISRTLEISKNSVSSNILLETLFQALKTVSTESVKTKSVNDGNMVAILSEKSKNETDLLKKNKLRRALTVPQTLMRIAALQERSGRPEVAEDLYRDAINLFKDLKGVGHPIVADALCELAYCVGDQSHTDSSQIGPLDDMKIQDKKAQDKFTYAVRILREAGSIYSNDLAELEDIADQKESLDPTLESEMTASKAYKVIDCLLQIAQLNESHGFYFKARDNFEVIMSVYQKYKIGRRERLAGIQFLYGQLLVASANAMSDSEQSLSERGGDLMEARTLFENALRSYRMIHGELHVDVGKTLVSLGGVYMDLEEWEEAMPFFDDALAVLAVTPGGDSAQLAECHNMIGSTLQALGVTDEAKEAFKESLRIYVALYGSENGEVAKVTNNFATLLEETGEKNEALFFYEKALSTVKRLRGEFNPQVLVILDNIASLFRDMELYDEALDVTAQADVISTRLLARVESKKGVNLTRSSVLKKQGQTLDQTPAVDRALAEYDIPAEEKSNCSVM